MSGQTPDCKCSNPAPLPIGPIVTMCQICGGHLRKGARENATRATMSAEEKRRKIARLRRIVNEALDELATLI